MESAKFSPKVKSNKKLVCSVKSCNSTSNKDLELCFHYFPINTNRFIYVKNIFGKVEKKSKLEAWMKAVGIKEVNSGMKICSRHFNVDDYILPNAPAKLRRSKNTAVPSLNLPNSTNETAKYDRKVRAVKRNIKKTNLAEKLQQVQPTGSDQSVEENLSENIEDVSDPITNNEDNASTSCEKYKSSSTSTQDIGVQVETIFLKSNVINMLKNDAQLSTFTGIESFDILNSIVEIVTVKFGNQLNHQNVKMSIRDKVVMTYVKLKQNSPYNCLAILFDCCSESTCRRVFLEMIKSLSVCLKGIIKWPSKETVQKNLPLCFEGFEDTRVVLDCTEIFIQQPKNLCCQVLTYSSYKKGQTCKFMTGVTPAGNISFISHAYGGRTSDKAIFNDCGIAKLLEPGDGVMVDRGFNIEDECAANKCKMYRPPFLKGKNQFSKEESIETAKVAKARVHVERSNQRIKTFKIMSETMPSFLVPIVDDIFTIICATVNLGSPIIDNKNFMKT